MSPTPTATPLTYLSLKDFSAGIRANPCDSHPSLIPAPAGVANPTNTYRCRPLPFGGLGPMPAIDHSIGVNSSSTIPRDDQIHITGFHVTGPITQNVVPAFFNSTFDYPTFPDRSDFDPVFFHIAVDYIESVAGHWRRRFAWLRIDPVTSVLTVVSGSASVVDDAVDLYAGSAFVSARSVGDTSVGGSRAATDPGSPVVALGFQTYYPGELENLLMFPDPTTDVTEKANTPIAPIVSISGRVVAHQTRIVTSTRENFAYGVGKVIGDGAVITWTKPNEIAFDASGTYFEGNGAVGAWASMTASDLFIVSTREGGILVQGDLNSPTVRKLPSVTPTYGIETNGVVTPIGFVYGTNHHGVQVWAGGSGSYSLSPHLPGDFFFSPSFAKSPIFKGQFAHWGEWIMAPFNWAYHIETKSWWRIEDPNVVDIPFWFPAPHSKVLYGAVGTYSAHSVEEPIIYSFPIDHLASSYRWESQVITPESLNRVVQVRELTLLVDGPGTVTVTITGLNDTSSTPVVFDLHDTGPEIRMSTEIALNCAGMVVRIDADSLSTSPAPIVHELRIGYTTLTRAAS